MKRHFYKNVVIKLLYIFLVAVSMILPSFVLSLPVYGKDSNSKSTDTTIPKVINIVYDDSASMVPSNKPDDQRWCSAMYALEVFTAMMGEKDVINIYRMSEYDASNKDAPVVKTIRGNDSSRVSQVHNLECNYTNTPYKSIEAAAANLKGVSKDNDRWLVILTDGAKFDFGDGSESNEKVTQERLTEYLNEYARDYKVAYLGIGAQAAAIDSQSANMMTWTAKTGDEILTEVTEIANSIFEHQILSSNYYTTSGSTYTLNIDIPTKQIIVFAQGEDVSMGDLTLNGEKISGEQQNVKYVEEGEKGFPKSTLYPNIKPTTDNYKNLKGVVKVYEAKDDPFSDGKFEVDVSGARTVEFYYKAGVNLSCILYDENGQIVDTSSGIEAGDYSVEVGFVNPLTGQAVSSSLLNVVSKELSIINNGNSLDVTSGKVTLEEGTLQISSSIELEGNVKAESNVEYEVKPKSVDLEIQLSIPEENYKAQNLNKDAKPIVATLIDKNTGTVITQEQWENCKVSVSGDKEDKYIEWECEKGSSVGTYNIWPLSKSDKNTTKIESGKHYFQFDVKMKTEDKPIEKSANGYVLIEAYEGTQLLIEADPVDTPVRVPAIRDFKGIKVTVYMLDDTGQKIPISQEVWECLKLKCVKPKTKRVNWTIEQGSEVGTYYIKPGYPMGLQLFMYGAVNGRNSIAEFVAEDGTTVNKYSDIVTGLSAKGELGPMIFSGEGQAEMKVSPLTWKEIWALIWKYVVGAAIFLFLLIGYLKKKRIYRRGLKPHLVYGKNEIDCAVHIKRRLIPYIPERAIIENSDSTMKCNIANLYIEAATNKSFRILNAEDVLNPPIRIKEEVLGPADAAKVAKRKYAYSGFNMAPIPKAGRRVGMFHMSRKR